MNKIFLFLASVTLGFCLKSCICTGCNCGHTCPTDISFILDVNTQTGFTEDEIDTIEVDYYRVGTDSVFSTAVFHLNTETKRFLYTPDSYCNSNDYGIILINIDSCDLLIKTQSEKHFKITEILVEASFHDDFNFRCPCSCYTNDKRILKVNGTTYDVSGTFENKKNHVILNKY